MNTRQWLVRSFAATSLLGLAMSAWPFAASMMPSAEAWSRTTVLVDMPELERGIPVRLEVEGTPLFILRPTEAQRQALRALDAHVWSENPSAYRADLDAYVVWGISQRFGCRLQDQPPQPSRITQFDPHAQWLGGYWDPWCEVSYDYSGRAIHSYGFTFNGLTWVPEPLVTPAIFERQGNRYLLSLFPLDARGVHPLQR